MVVLYTLLNFLRNSTQSKKSTQHQASHTAVCCALWTPSPALRSHKGQAVQSRRVKHVLAPQELGEITEQKVQRDKNSQTRRVHLQLEKQNHQSELMDNWEWKKLKNEQDYFLQHSGNGSFIIYIIYLRTKNTSHLYKKWCKKLNYPTVRIV